MITKKCTKCKLEKSLECFSNRARNKTDGKQPQCKSCDSIYQAKNFEMFSKRHKLYRERVKDKRSAMQKVYRDKRRKEMGDKIREYHKNYAAANKDRLKAKRLLRREKERQSLRRYSKKNRALMNALHSKRKALQKRAIPIWADYKLINAFYRVARELTEATGVDHEVDHIVPIKSKIVCGLHCQQNLQILTATENNKKGNRVWPDMP